MGDDRRHGHAHLRGPGATGPNRAATWLLAPNGVIYHRACCAHDNFDALDKHRKENPDKDH
jgi:hypothetical protein